ncbi:uncharacterized protein LOC131317256 [Rhododendron vialii]|uniref:uncharacterized protein LOC131317256 n=1 Tax=Rhododendron vialii TaxID=182163 RepID=UPI0026605811|nr:uncharacterized protein LOC131317256 [Rhododendron vialii]
MVGMMKELVVVKPFVKFLITDLHTVAELGLRIPGRGHNGKGLVFRGHDEFEHSSNQGNFLELLKFLADHDEEVKGVTLDNAPQNLLIGLDIQKDIVSAAAFETVKAIVKDLDDSIFSVLVDEARNISIKEQMAVTIRYVER